MRSTKLLSSISALIGLQPVPAPPHVFAVEQGRLAYARLGRLSSGYEVRAWDEEPLPPGTFQKGLLGGPVREPQVLSKALAAVLGRIDGPAVKQASLVVPDSWLRVTFAESGALPRRSQARDEVLRWKLKRLVPFRVDELRIRALEVEPLNGHGGEAPTEAAEDRRFLLGFALEALLEQLEKLFAGAGIRLGAVNNASLSLLDAVGSEGDGLTGLVLADDDGYALAFARRGLPLLHRFKGSGAGIETRARGSFVRRDLMLTRTFLAEQLPGVPLERVLLAAPEGLEGLWLSWLGEGLGCEAEPLGPQHLPLRPGSSLHGNVEAPTWRDLGPLLGAARREVL